MVQCTTCGASERDDHIACSHCGAPLQTIAGVISDAETMALPQRTPSPSNSSTTTPRLTLTATADEGRFIPGTLVAGRYRVIGLLGRGGMGEVYRATDLALAQSVALKILPEEAAANEVLLERFHNEVRVARQVSHPNVCRVYDIGEADGLPFISMEYVDGEDLAGLLQRIGRLPSDKALEISRKLCAGLAAAHERGVIHRDLKPQNIMLDRRGQVVIMDFGLAAVANSLRGAEARNGTPAYMSPEQLRGDSVSAKSDIYALGLIIYELFTGRRAYEANSVAELLSLQESSRPVSMTSIAHDVDPMVEKVILRCLQADPAQRPANALSIAAALPGGDPLAAALAAGEMPSPELVAASGKMEGFKPRYAIPCIAFVLLALLLYPFLMRPLSMLAVTPTEFPPVVLEQKARDLAANFGYTSKPVDWYSSFEWNGPLILHLRGKSESAKNWKQLFAAQPAALFRYRQSQAYLLSPSDGDITSERPAPDMPGMISVLLDSRGQLRSFRAIAPRLDESVPEEPPPLDPAPVFRAAGFDIGQFEEIPPKLAPVLPFDARRAWKGEAPGLPDTPITVEVATWHGKLASFQIRWPWTKSDNSSEEAPKTADIAFDIFTTLCLVSALLSAIYVAHLNLRKNRGDRQGAFRVAAFQFALFIVIFSVNMHVVPRTDMVSFITLNLAFGLAMSSVFWLLYMALEPAVRARWPHSMITWNRLLAGQLGDPRLGSHILVGVVIGVGMRCVFIWREHFVIASGGAPDQTNLDSLFGVRWLVNGVTNKFWNAVLVGLAIFFLLSGLRYLVRRDWLVAGIAAILLTLQEGELRSSLHPYLDYPLYLGIYAIFGFALLRMGLVPTIIGIFVVNLMSSIPVSGDFSAWYNPVTFVELAMVAAIAIYGFWRSQSANPDPQFRDSDPPAAKAL
jgi:predicted Ser/Thr protein kinase